MAQETLDQKELEVPIERLRFFSDEKLSFCAELALHSVRCPKNPKLAISQLSKDECGRCIKESNK